jgi:hypothetical protein
MSKGIEALVESRLAAMGADRDRLTKAWGPHISSVESYFAKQGKTITENDKRNIARCLENALLEGGIRSRSSIFETTDSSAIQFLGIQLPVIAALLPSLVLNKLAVTQALDRRSGAVFYLDVRYGTNKGSVSAAQDMMNAQTGHNSTIGGREYASVRVKNEVVPATTSPFTLGYFPVVSGSLVITDNITGNVLTVVSSSGGVDILASSLSAGHTGTCTLATGVVTIAAGGLSNAGVASYMYDWQTGGVGGATAYNVPEVNIAVTAATITAEDFPLKALFTLGAAIDLEKAHGLNLEDELVKYLGGEVKFTMDHLGIDLMNVASQGTGCATSPGTYTAAPSTGEAWVWKKYQFLDFVEKANVNIIQKTLRAVCNFLVVGNDAARLIRQLAPNFVPAAGLNTLVPTGPYELGTLDGRLVIHDPLLGATEILFGFKGDNYLFAGFLFAPYIPLFATPTLVTADLKAQKGFLASAGYKVVNPGMYTHGAITIV